VLDGFIQVTRAAVNHDDLDKGAKLRGRGTGGMIRGIAGGRSATNFALRTTAVGRDGSENPFRHSYA